MISVLLLGLKWLGLLLGAALLIRLIIPRRLDRPRCRKCGYDMTGLISRNCPECGRKHKSEIKLLRKPAGKRQIALMLVLLLGGYGAHVGGKIIEQGLPSVVPNTVLIAFYPTILNAARHRSGVIAQRLDEHLISQAYNAEEDLWTWQRRWLRTRAASLGLDGERMLEALGGFSEMSDDQRDTLIALTLPKLIEVRNVTPLDAPIYATCRFGSRLLSDSRLIITPTFMGGVDAEFVYQNLNSTRNPIVLGSSSEPVPAIVLDVDFQDLNSAYRWSGSVRTHARVQGSMDDVLPAMRTPELSNCLEQWAQPQLKLDYQLKSQDEYAVLIYLIPLSRFIFQQGNSQGSQAPFPVSAVNASLTMRAELLWRDKPIGGGDVVAQIVHRGPVIYAEFQYASYNTILKVDPDLFWNAIESSEPLDVRYRSLPPAEALKTLKATQRWEGELTIPLSGIRAEDHSGSWANRKAVQPIEFRSYPLFPVCIFDEDGSSENDDTDR